MTHQFNTCNVCQAIIQKRYGESWHTYLKRSHCSNTCSAVTRRGSRRKPGVRLTTAQREEAAKLYVEGKSLVRVAEVYGCCAATIWDILQELGVSCRTSGPRSLAGMTSDQKTQRSQHILRKKHSGWEPNQFETAWAQQEGKCALCGVLMVRRGTSLTSVSADHCHRTGQTRSLLCAACNRGIGCLKEDPTLLRMAADYLEKFR